MAIFCNDSNDGKIEIVTSLLPPCSSPVFSYSAGPAVIKLAKRAAKWTLCAEDEPLVMREMMTMIVKNCADDRPADQQQQHQQEKKHTRAISIPIWPGLCSDDAQPFVFLFLPPLPLA